MVNKGKGLNPDQMQRFLQNEECFRNDFLGYMKTITDKREIEFAQLRRKYQSSFIDQGNFTARFMHKFSNPDEFSEKLSHSTRKNGLFEICATIPEDFEEIGCKIIILSEFTEEFKSAFEQEISNLSIKYKSLFSAMKNLDTHIQMISDRIIASVQEFKNLLRKSQLERLMQLAKATKGLVQVSDESPPPALLEPISKKPVEEIQDKIAASYTKEEIEEEVNPEDKKTDPEEAKTYVNVQIQRTKLKIMAKQMTFRNLGSASLVAFTIEIQCDRCYARVVRKCELSAAALEEGDYLFTSHVDCACTLPLSFEIVPSIVFAKSGKQIGTGKFNGCTPLDLIEMDYKFTCAECGEYIALLQSRSYVPYIINCHECFTKGTFQIDGIDFPDVGEKSEENDKEKKFIGKPLPKNGVCKHFNNSFRWFKFPCCQRLFPCMICHDDNADHTSVKAEIYLCGFCGSLQKFGSRDVCKKCGGSVNGLDGNKRFWEGGKGCRNTMKMSRNDKKKFKVKK